MKTKSVLQATTTIAVIFLGSALLATAQPDRGYRPGRRTEPAEPPPPSEKQPDRSRPSLPPSSTGLERLFGVLTQEQRQSLREVLLEAREQGRETEHKIRELRSELLELALARNFREDDFRRKANEVARLEAERLVQMAKAFAQVQPPLSPEQIEKVKRATSRGGDSRNRGSRGSRDGR